MGRSPISGYYGRAFRPCLKRGRISGPGYYGRGLQPLPKECHTARYVRTYFPRPTSPKGRAGKVLVLLGEHSSPKPPRAT